MDYAVVLAQINCFSLSVEEKYSCCLAKSLKLECFSGIFVM